MAKVSGFYSSVTLGVSQQPPHSRRSGQMEEQVNMISDPVQGLSRRWGSMYLSKAPYGSASTNMVDYSKYSVKSFNSNAIDYDLLYSKVGIQGDPVCLYNKTSNNFMQVNGAGLMWDALKENGASAVVSVGRFVLLSVNGWKPEYTSQSVLQGSGGSDAAIWIRNGDYSRQYSALLTKVDGTVVKSTYTTPPSTYPTALDTSDISVPTFNVPEGASGEDINRVLALFNRDMAQYNKQVADRTNAYNSAVTSHIGIAAAAIQPAAIAERLAALIRTDNALTEDVVINQGAYIFIKAAAGFKSGQTIEVADNFIKVVFNAVTEAEDLTPRHFAGKVVKIQPKKSTGKDAYYMKAVPVDAGTSDYGPVSWQETAGVVITPIRVMLIGVLSGDALYVRDTVSELRQITGDNTIPELSKSSAGDLASSNVPVFLNNTITHMGVFQDRLIISTGSTVFGSRPGAYFNWFRQSILDVLDDDPVEMYALGSENDVIRWDVPFDRNLVLFGERFQYILNSKSNLTPKNPSIQIMSTIEDAARAQPQSSGSLVFYCKDLDVKGGLHQFQVGATSESTESTECSQQLDDYIQGSPVQIVCNQAPWVVMVRTDGYPYGVYLYTYLDGSSQRLFDSWSRWEWSADLGPCCGVSKYKGNLIIYTLRVIDGSSYIVADKFTLNTGVSSKPYLDSNGPVETVSSRMGVTDNVFMAYAKTHAQYLQGTPYTKRDLYIPDWAEDTAHLVAGSGFPTYTGLTSPYPQTSDGVSDTRGRMTVTSVDVAVKDTGGLVGVVKSRKGYVPSRILDGRVLGSSLNAAGKQPLLDKTLRVSIGYETRDYILYVEAKDWLPLTITSVSWTGQLFNRVRRV